MFNGNSGAIEGAKCSRVLSFGNSLSLQPSGLMFIGRVERHTKASSSYTEVCPPNLFSFVKAHIILLSPSNIVRCWHYAQALSIMQE